MRIQGAIGHALWIGQLAADESESPAGRAVYLMLDPLTLEVSKCASQEAFERAVRS